MSQIGLPTSNMGFSQRANYFGAFVARWSQIVNRLFAFLARTDHGSTAPMILGPGAVAPLGPTTKEYNQTISDQVLLMIGGQQDRSDGAVNSSTGHGPLSGWGI